MSDPGKRAARIGVLVAATIVAVVLGVSYPLAVKGPLWFSARWENPWLLVGLVVIPFVFYRTTLGADRRVPRLRLGTVRPLLGGPLGFRVWVRDVPGVLRSVALALLILSTARPVNTIQPETSEEEGIDVVLVLDLSGSMEAVIENLPEDLKRLAPERQQGLQPTRLDAAKAVIRDFISRRKTDRIGVVVFGKEAYVLSPPTLDYQLLDALVSHMELNLIDGSATAIGDALGVAVARLRRSHAASKAIVLLTDGDNNAGRLAPEYSAHLASVVGARVYTVQIGSGELAQALDGFDLFGQPHYVTKNYPTNPELLKKIAQQTGGRTYVATDARALQASLHDVLNQLEKTKFESTIASFEDLYRYLLLPGVFLVAMEAFLRAFVQRRFP
ncbi:MAG TPA: VWA domain-containing protein [Polyangiaceae bacterium]|jgi:Ca-activated chloride channel family protein|nr:VWA domain-containing protein [Polyangiaceae bacterium]